MGIPMTGTAAEFVAWLVTPTGLAIVVVAILGLLKAKVKGFVAIMDEWGLPITIVLAAVIAGLGYLVLQMGWLPYIEQYWPLLILVWAASQAVYAAQKGATHLYAYRAGMRRFEG